MVTENRLSAEEERALFEFEEALVVMKQAIRKLRSSDHPELSENAFAILGVVKRMQPTRVSDLAAELGLAVSTMSRKVEPLVHCGWLQTTQDTNDQRAYLLSVTPKGHGALRTERRRKIARLVELLDDETRSNFAEMAAFFTKVARRLHEATETNQLTRKGSTTVGGK